MYRSVNYIFCSRSKETVITKNYMEPIYVKEARLTNKLEIMSAVRTILNCARLS